MDIIFHHSIVLREGLITILIQFNGGKLPLHMRMVFSKPNHLKKGYASVKMFTCANVNFYHFIALGVGFTTIPMQFNGGKPCSHMQWAF